MHMLYISFERAFNVKNDGVKEYTGLYLNFDQYENVQV